jgi:hypothetical protein
VTVATEPLLYNAAQASERLNGALSPYWLARKAGAGLIPHTRIGRFVRFSEANLAELVANNHRDPADYGRKKRR